MTSNASSPLSWREARTNLKVSLQEYLETSINRVRPSETNMDHRQSTSFFVSIWYKWDLDVVIGAICMSVSLLVIAVLTFTSVISSVGGDDYSYHRTPFAPSQLAGAILLFWACAINAWLIMRYRYSASHGTDSLKRRMISKFLKELKEQEGRCRCTVENATTQTTEPNNNGIDLVGTSLTDIYPVYRLKDNCTKQNTCEGSWSRVPTLLLVKGDRIALQVGDTAPAKCRVLEGKKSMTVVQIGQEITFYDSSGENVGSLVGKISRGRTTLPSHDSDGLLRLCNDVRIFEVLETPLESFLREPQHESKKPQFFRQLDAVRGALSLVAIALFVFTTVVLLGRYPQFSSNLLYLLPSPFLAAIGIFPVVGPGYLILIEALGTARILASYHPVASRTRMDDSSDMKDHGINVDILIFRYFLATLSNRLSLQHVGNRFHRMFHGLSSRSKQGKTRGGSSSMVWVPPASLNLLGKLGVATAFTLVDDELVCEPQAIPQQLLIPSGRGLKLLDLCPTYEDESEDEIRGVGDKAVTSIRGHDLLACKTALTRLVCRERNSMQLRSLARCIGFSTNSNNSGSKGDATPFSEKQRLHVVDVARLRERFKIDSHERGSEESRWWGLLRADSTSVIVQDSRSGAYQLLTVGEPKVVTRMCHEAWQGENSTILPLASYDRSTILETSDSWKLSDLDVEAFSYAPIPHTFESRFTENTESTGLLSTLQDAGVRFVYFSPRNMRRQKELASQMGIDVAWNCAISLRTLVQGEDDPHRMVSNYADWDVNAKLPHGIESVRRHLRDVDNVPLLVSLFTDATKETTAEMIDIFQEYNDTVIAVGVSHLPRNTKIFSTADLAIGVDMLSECLGKAIPKELKYDALLPSEVIFASAISAHFCAFRLEGIGSVEHMPTILAQGRASFAAATSATIFFLCGFLSFTLYVSLTVCSVATTIPHVPIIGSALYLLIILPLVGIPISMTDPDSRCMQQVPPKNDVSMSFGKKEGRIFSLVSFLKALPPAIFPQLLYLIAFGELMIELEPDIVQVKCMLNPSSGNWASVIRCRELGEYSGVSRDVAVSLSLAELALLTVVTSATFVYRTIPIWEEPPWRRNNLWAVSVLIALVIIALYLLLSIGHGIFSSLPWYYFVLAYCAMPLICILWNEYLKRSEKSVLDRAEKLRRLQFETRLGMWSPK
eukprot:jgi/Psemu1/327288/estExt_fgenesh1_pg.C_6050003